MTPYADPNVIYVLHYYSPQVFTLQGASWISPAAYGRLRHVPWPAFQPALGGLLEKERDPEVRALLQRYRDEDWDASRIDWDIGLAAAWARKWRVHLIVDEFGDYKPYSAPAERADWLHEVVSSLERRHIAWTMWDYAGGFDLIDNVKGKRSIDPLVAAALGFGEWSTALLSATARRRCSPGHGRSSWAGTRSPPSLAAPLRPFCQPTSMATEGRTCL